MDALLNVADVEATCWEGQPPAGQVSEIIGLGLTVVDLGRRERVAKHGSWCGRGDPRSAGSAPSRPGSRRTR